jgi:mono/diheme cytochrome c family protein
VREKWARRIAMLTGGLVVVLSIVFASYQNPHRREPVAVPSATPADDGTGPAIPAARAPASVPPAPTKEPSDRVPTLVNLGQEIYVEQACARCHSIAGRGSDRSPLDGVGARLSEAEIRAWLTPSAEAKGFRARHANLELTPTQRDALVAYLRGLR